MALSPLLDPLVRLRLRSSPRRLGQRAQDAAPRQLDLEVVVAEAARVPQHGVSGTHEVFARGWRSIELRFGLCATPPSARRASLIVSPSISRPTATDTRANAYDRRSRTFR